MTLKGMFPRVNALRRQIVQTTILTVN